MNNSCLYNVVGISKKECDCLDGKADNNDYNLSHSGLFSDDTEHGLSILTTQNSKDCGEGSAWSILEETREEAINSLITHFLIESEKVKNTILNNTTISIGDKEGNLNIDANTIAGVFLCPKIYKGVSFYLKTVDLYIDTLQDYTLILYNVTKDQQVKSVTAQAGNNATYSFVFNESLPLYDSNGEKQEYLIYYDTLGASPMSYEFSCGCQNKYYKWKDFFIAFGDTRSDLSSLLESTAEYNKTYGLRIHGNLECEPLSWLCDINPSFWSNTEFGRVFAMTLLNYWTIKNTSRILNSNRISYYSTLKREELYGKRNKAQKIVNELVPFLAQNMPEELSHCYNCDYNYGFQKMSIISA